MHGVLSMKKHTKNLYGVYHTHGPLIRTRVPQFLNKVYKTVHSLMVPLFDIFIPVHHNILCVLGKPEGKILIPAHNIVTDAGDKEYAQAAANEITLGAATQFDSLYLSTVNWDASHPAKTSTTDNLASVITGAESLPETGYPKTNDTDVDNTGGGVDVITWKFFFSKASFSDTDIDAGAITLDSLTSWGANAGTDNILTGFDLTAFGKTSNDTLTLFANHTVAGV
jgi:hypothetical protein